MYDFLSKFKLSTRVCTGFALLGAFAALLSFAGMFSVGAVHREYMSANNTIESVRRLSALETSLFSLNRSLLYFSDKTGGDDLRGIQDALADYELKVSEIEPYLEDKDVREKYSVPLKASVGTYRADLDEMLALRDKSVGEAEKARLFAGQASERLSAMIEEATLPSATFALNALQEQLDTLTGTFEAAASDKDEAERQKQVSEELDALKKAANAAKQAEMVNSKQLKVVLTAIGNLEEEVRGKMKTDKALAEKVAAVARTGKTNAALLKELIDVLVMNSAHLMTDAESYKLLFQKLFVLAAGFAGILTVVLAFLSLWGIRYPLSRLIENLQEIARGDRSVYINFTDRSDEIGALAQAMAALLSNLRGQSAAFNAVPSAYVPLGAATAPSDGENEDKDVGEGDGEFAYFGEGAGDAESQLCRMLALVKHIHTAAETMSVETDVHFSEYRKHLETLTGLLTRLLQETESLFEHAGRSVPQEFASLTEKAAEMTETYGQNAQLLATRAEKGSEASEAVLKQVDAIKVFSSGLINWAHIMAELSDSVQKMASRTKILALNASIEAAKTGEKAKSFGNSVAEIRNQAQQTAGTAEQLLANLRDMQNETYAFAQTVDETVNDVRSVYALSADVASMSSAQNGRFAEQAELLKTVGDRASLTVEYCTGLENALGGIADAVRKAGIVLPDIKAETDAVRKNLSEFISELPTYEE